MKVLHVTFPMMLLLITSVASGHQASSLPRTARASEVPSPCKSKAFPPDIENKLRGEFGSWRIQEPSDLNPIARQTWESAKNPGCPGIAVGRFESATTPSYAVLLVPMSRPDAAYKLLVFSRKSSQASYERKILEQWDNGGASNFFIRAIPIEQFFDEQSKRKFHVGAGVKDGLLFVDSAENEYEANVYFWANGSYQHEPVDY